MPDPSWVREEIRRDRFRAHSLLFRHRHEYLFAPFHRDLIEDFWRDDWRYIDLGFRESGKTTLVEEAVTLAFCESAFRNCLIVGAKESLAAELLTNIRVELEQNDELISVYGFERGATWTQTKITSAAGYCIQAVGRDQSLRGTKHREWRPDLVVINDFEDDEEVLSADGRRRTLRWVLRVLLPACDRRRRKIRIYDTIRDNEAVPMTLIKQGWPHRLIPVSYLDDAGEERSSWPGHPTLTMEWIRNERNAYFALGEGDIWQREMEMSTTSQGDKTFDAETIRIVPRERSWEPIYAMIDPARRARGQAAFTGWAVWSWIKNRLVVWDAGAQHLLPDEIVDLAFSLAVEYDVIELGIEKDGLAEWMEQPMRQRMIREGRYIPFRAVAAPRGEGQTAFVAGLQPFYASGEIQWTKDFPALREQMQNFPRGRRDALNALAYAIPLRPGRLVYEDFRPTDHVAVDIPVAPWQPLYLAANARDRWVTGALVQVVEGRLRILADWALEGMPDERVSDLAQAAGLFNVTRRVDRAPRPADYSEALKLPDERMIVSRRELGWVIPDSHFDRWLNIGMAQAIGRLPAHPARGGQIAEGREWLRDAMSRSSHGEDVFQVTETARWTCRALAGGYSRDLREAEPRPGPYRCLMEGLESWAALLSLGHFDAAEDDELPNYSYNRAGQRYLSAIPERRH